MKVILLQELKGKGGEGDVIDVAPGFANNYLLRNGYAVLATKGNLKQLEQRKGNIAKREEKRLADANELQAKLEGSTIRVDARVGEEGVLFGSVTSAMIADAIKNEMGVEIDKRRIDLGSPIKTAGEHQVNVSLYRDIKAAVKVLVASEGEEVPEEETAEDASEETAEAAEEATDAAAEQAAEATDENAETEEVVAEEIEKASEAAAE